MSLKIQIDSDIELLSRWLTDTQKKHLPSAVRNALNETAEDVMKFMRADLPNHIHRPTKFTTKQLQYERAEKNRLVSKVGFSSKFFGRPAGDGSAHYMKLLIDGGTRYPKRTAVAVPVDKNYKTNVHGNIRRGDIKRFLANDKKYFSGTPNGEKFQGSAGIWKRMGRGGRKNLRMVIAYEDKTQYLPQYRFPTIAKNVAGKLFKPAFQKHLGEVLKKKNVHGIRGWLK